MRPFFESIFSFEKDSSNMALIALEGAEELGKKVDSYLVNWYNNEAKASGKKFFKDTFLVGNKCPRFTTGDGKGLINDSIRGKDLFIICDVGNYSIEYNMFGTPNRMSPDDHYSDLKRIICACAGIANKITVIMPLLYGGRQHRRVARESLDCAQMLRELEFMGVKDIITFDAHDPRVQNAIPLHGFETVQPAYQFIKAILREVDDLQIDSDHMMVISPDEGGTNRAIYLANVLGLDMGMFYKRRDYSKIVDGRNPIVAHEFLGSSVENKDVFIIDDMISSGDSMIDVATELKKRKANRIFVISTFGLFTNGLEKFDRAVEDGIIYKVVTTNLTYQTPELLAKPYYINCDMSKYIAYIIDTLNHDISISDLLDPYERIEPLVKKYKLKKKK